uniref:ComEA family DNA-binding protein n=1 Tax=Desulfobacca sp. TaxID=2067990 RepID=UPI00404B323B
MLPRQQQLIILLLGLGLSALLAWRTGWPWSGGPSPLPPIPYHFVAISGDVPQPGVRVFATPPTVAMVWQAAGGQGEIAQSAENVRSGAVITVSPDRQVSFATMAGADLVTLGLALDLNQASAADLEAVPGLGPVLARRIIDCREEHGPFREIEDLLQVKGIGPKLLEKIRPYVVIIDEAAPPAAERSEEAESDGEH